MRLDTIRLAARHLARNPGYATLSIAAIALGVGATTAVFSLFSAVLLWGTVPGDGFLPVGSRPETGSIPKFVSSPH